MSERAREWVFWVLFTVLVAAVVHLGSIYLLPRVVMARAMARMGAPNEMRFPHRADAASRTIVRPSPDLLYAACAYDLSRGPLRVTAPVVHATYWSVSAFDAASDNFFVRDDRQLEGNSVELLLIRPHQPWPVMDNALQRIIAFSQSEKGVILIRMVVDDEKHAPALEAVLRQSRCETVASRPALR